MVEYCQQRDNTWNPFTKEEMLAYCYVKGYEKPESHKDPATESAILLRLIRIRDSDESWLIVEDGKYYPTEELIERCHASSPQP